MPQVDVVIEVLNARLPFCCTNPVIEKLRGDKPYLKVMVSLVPQCMPFIKRLNLVHVLQY